ncbi:hypothetical protein E4631_15660 [Hymenobacter sp. UV11]|uniref:hypothetical protein n=1 Tax=Hymenobacter sp. UV11 TaxID=1849735 RepID=UPI00106038B7|nr:hypothetical protein [Hymenobacter sp. UV11]TFZ65654.1 hypothetical protein E4631_15660 [Hymenobacter sp. UV11]
MVISWKQQEVKETSQLENFYFFHDSNPVCNYKHVFLSSVTSSNYFGAYVGWTWQYMRDNLKRTIVTEANCNEMINNPQLYGVNDVIYNQYGNEYSIVSGHHRTCIAKFLERKCVFVKVNEYRFDNELFDLYHKLCKSRIEIKAKDKVSHPKWELYFSSFKITTSNREGIISFSRYYESLNPNFWESTLLRFSRFRDWITSKDDYYYWDINKIRPSLRWLLLMYKTNASQLPPINEVAPLILAN